MIDMEERVHQHCVSVQLSLCCLSICLSVCVPLQSVLLSSSCCSLSVPLSVFVLLLSGLSHVHGVPLEEPLFCKDC